MAHHIPQCYTLYPINSTVPSNKHRVAINLPDNEYAKLAALAKKHAVSMAWIGRQALLDFIEKHQNTPLQLPLTLVRERRQGTHG